MITASEAIRNNRGSMWVSFTCPSHFDTNPSARLQVGTGKWVCMSCSASGTLDAGVVDPEDTIRYIRSLLAVAGVSALPEASLDMYDIDGPGEYWPSRFSLRACREFRLGQDGDYPVYPLRDPAGRLMGVVRRNPYGERPKYKYPRGVSTSRYLFGFERLSEVDGIVLVEGAPDVIAAWEVGVPAVGSYGSALSADQMALIARLSPSIVVVAYDNDRAGQKGRDEAVRGLLAMGVPAVPVIEHQYHDVAEMPLETRGRILRESLDGRDIVGYLLSCE